MTLKEFSRQFGVSISEICEITGYTRQGLYLVINGKTGNSDKKKAAWDNLIRYAAYQFNIEWEKTKSNFKNRPELAEIFQGEET